MPRPSHSWCLWLGTPYCPPQPMHKWPPYAWSPLPCRRGYEPLPSQILQGPGRVQGGWWDPGARGHPPILTWGGKSSLGPTQALLGQSRCHIVPGLIEVIFPANMDWKFCLGAWHFSGRGNLALLGGGGRWDHSPASIISKLGGRACRIRIPLVLASVRDYRIERERDKNGERVAHFPNLRTAFQLPYFLQLWSRMECCCPFRKVGNLPQHTPLLIIPLLFFF